MGKGAGRQPQRPQLKGIEKVQHPLTGSSLPPEAAAGSAWEQSFLTQSRDTPLCPRFSSRRVKNQEVSGVSSKSVPLEQAQLPLTSRHSRLSLRWIPLSAQTLPTGCRFCS